MRVDKSKRDILIVTPQYLPGFQAGGPVKTISNLILALGDEFSFSVLTSDRDIGATSSYGLETRKWHPVGKGRVMYLSPGQKSLWQLARTLRETRHDALCLNGVFPRLTARILLLRRLRWIRETPVLLAPRGECSPGAIRLKAGRKRVYLWMSGFLGFYRNIIWQASTSRERLDIEARGPVRPPFVDIRTAADLVIAESGSQTSRPQKQKGYLKALFLSRIARMKNLHVALELINQSAIQINFDIYGPIEDRRYWEECQGVMKRLGPHVHAEYRGSVSPDQISEVFSKYHLLFLPTAGENFGHVIIEALSAGCPALISDQTPWRDLEQHESGWVQSLGDPASFVEALERCANMDVAEWQAWSNGARRYAERYARQQNERAVEDNRKVLLSLLAGA